MLQWQKLEGAIHIVSSVMKQNHCILSQEAEQDVCFLVYSLTIPCIPGSSIQTLS